MKKEWQKSLKIFPEGVLIVKNKQFDFFNTELAKILQIDSSDDVELKQLVSMSKYIILIDKRAIERSFYF
jgi:hypothetical protein